MKPTHAQRLERWLGKEQVEEYSLMMRDWRGPPIAIANVPGLVYATAGGDFCGPIKGGYFGNFLDYSVSRLRGAMRRVSQRSQLNAGFTSLSDLISEATVGGKAQDLMFNKAATTATTAANAFSCFNVGNLPAAGGTGGTSGTGRICTSATTGALKFVNAAGGDTLHLTTFTAQATAISSLMLYDRLWDMTYNHATATSTAVDANNRPNRYQTAGSAPGNFIASEVTTAGTTAHTMTFTYVDQDGNTAEANTAESVDATAVAGRHKGTAGNWFWALNAGDTGLRYLTTVAQSTITSVTGVTNIWIGHPLCLIPLGLANVPFVYDGINSAFSLVQILDNACLAFYTPRIATTGNITYSGLIRVVSG